MRVPYLKKRIEGSALLLYGLSDGLRFSCKGWYVRNKNMRYVDLIETVCTGRSIIITL